MKNKHIFWGILFISFGIFILVNNISSYDFYYEEVWKLWPIVFILWGLSLILRQPLLRSILIGLTAFFLAFSIYSSIRTGFYSFDHDFTFDDNDTEINFNDSFTVNNFSEKFESGVKKATLNFDAGAGTFIIKNSTDSLFEAKTEGSGNNYSLNRNDNGNEAILDFMMKKKRFSFRHGHFKNKVTMKLNTTPVWDLNVNAGAADINLDLSNYKIENLHIEMGAASLKTTLGEPERETHVKLDAGVSSININIPQNVACEIRADASLSSKNFDGFKKIEDNLYQTENFNGSTKKIYMDIHTGVSSISVKRTTVWH